MAFATVWMTVSIFALSTVAVCVAAPPDQPKSKPCTAPEYRQFDFWVGDWDTFDVDNPNTVAARTKVDLLLDGCVLREDYLGADGLHGQSFNIYDESRKVWHQSWVTNRGQLLLIEGEMKDGAVVLSGTDQDAGKERRVRGTWNPEGKRNVRETAVVSTDGGKTWKVWVDMVLKPHQGSLSHNDPPSPASTTPSHVEASMSADEVTLRQLN